MDCLGTLGGRPFFPATAARSSRRTTRLSTSRMLCAEQLETRTLLAGDLVISEISFETSGLVNKGFFELKGDNHGVIPANTYLVTVAGNHIPGTLEEAGEVQSIFDLSGETLGANGYLAVTMSDHPASTVATGRVLTGTDEFSGIAGVPFSDTSGVSDGFDFNENSVSFLLIESLVAPTLTDVDLNDDGVLDVAWTILDSVAVLSSNPTSVHDTDLAYGDFVVRANGNQSPLQPGQEALSTENQVNYVARLGDTVGASADQWWTAVVGSDGIELDDGFSRNPIPFRMYGHDVATVGGPNHFTSIRGTVFDDDVVNGVLDIGEPGRAGFVAFLDRDGSGTHTNFSITADADDALDGEEINNAFHGVTLSEADQDGVPHSRFVFPVVATARPEASTGENVFGRFSDNWRLRMDFDSPASQVAIDVSTEFVDIGVKAALEVYDGDGNLLETTSTGLLTDAGTTMQITRDDAEIAYAIAYPHEIDFRNIFLDNLRFTIPEEYGISGVDGQYLINNVSPLLDAGNYDVVLHDGAAPITVAISDLVAHRHVDFALASGYVGAVHSFPASPPPIVVPFIPSGPTPVINNPVAANDIVGLSDGVWWIARSDASEFTNEALGEWDSRITWKTVEVGDFNGDGFDDLVGHAANGALWVALSSDDGLVASRWGTLSQNQRNLLVGDFNGDGFDDVAARVGNTWEVASSDGTSFTNTTWGTWAGNAHWRLIEQGDFNGDGFEDIVGFVNSVWWVAVSNGTSFTNEKFASWSRRVSWVDPQVGDFNGDGLQDVAARGHGAWWVGKSDGTEFASEFWSRWSTAVNWTHVTSEDMNNDGMDDIVGQARGKWFVARAARDRFVTRRWGEWNGPNWTDVVFADFNGDGRTDIAGRRNERWRVLKSTEQGFVDQLWGSWSDDYRFDHVLAGRFGESSSTLAEALASDSPDAAPLVPHDGLLG